MLGSMEFLVYLGLVGILVVWFILPLVPAILLYWLFPDSRIKAEGVLANFKVNAERLWRLSGAVRGHDPVREAGDRLCRQLPAFVLDDQRKTDNHRCE